MRVLFVTGELPPMQGGVGDYTWSLGCTLARRTVDVHVLTGREAGRTNSAEVTVFDSVGFALEDFSALRLMRELALDLGLGEAIDLIPPMADPKDLYSHLTAAAVCRKPRLRAA